MAIKKGKAKRKSERRLVERRRKRRRLAKRPVARNRRRRPDRRNSERRDGVRREADTFPAKVQAFRREARGEDLPPLEEEVLKADEPVEEAEAVQEADPFPPDPEQEEEET